MLYKIVREFGLYTGLLLLISAFSNTVQAQEKGIFRNPPKIRQATPPAKAPAARPPQKDPDEDFQIETSNITFQSQFEPAKPLNPVVSEDTLTIDEGETKVLEEVDSVKIGDDWVKVAEYYVIWDTKSINPYGIDPLQFDESIELKLYSPAENRFWNNPLDMIKTTSNFGSRWGRWHTGTDLDLETGDAVYSVFDGVVRVVGWDGRGYGNFVLVRHMNGLETLYGHLSKALVETEQKVKAGDVLGLGGSTGRSTGSHLHFENRYEGNPFDPRYIFDWDNAQIKSDRFLLTSQVWDFRRGGQSFKSDFDSAAETPAYSRTLFHKVRSGETLYSIANRYGTTISTLAKRNRISVQSKLRVGQKLRVR